MENFENVKPGDILQMILEEPKHCEAGWTRCMTKRLGTFVKVTKIRDSKLYLYIEDDECCVYSPDCFLDNPLSYLTTNGVLLLNN